MCRESRPAAELGLVKGSKLNNLTLQISLHKKLPLWTQRSSVHGPRPMHALCHLTSWVTWLIFSHQVTCVCRVTSTIRRAVEV